MSRIAKFTDSVVESCIIRCEKRLDYGQELGTDDQRVKTFGDFRLRGH